MTSLNTMCSSLRRELLDAWNAPYYIYEYFTPLLSVGKKCMATLTKAKIILSVSASARGSAWHKFCHQKVYMLALWTIPCLQFLVSVWTCTHVHYTTKYHTTTWLPWTHPTKEVSLTLRATHGVVDAWTCPLRKIKTGCKRTSSQSLCVGII